MRKVIYIIGCVFIVISFCFLVNQISHYGLSIFSYPHKIRLSVIIIISGSFYAIVIFFCAVAWHHILTSIGSSINFHSTYLIYSRSQIAKYFPGNIFHYIGRQAMGHMIGLKQSSIFIATVIETILLVIIGIAIAIWGILSLGFGQGKLKLLIVAELVSISSFIILIIILPGILRYFSFLQKFLGDLTSFNKLKWFKIILLPLVIYTFNFFIIGSLLWITAILLFKIKISYRTLIAFTTVFASSWVLGFITPAVPGGIGVREAILTAGLSPFIGTSIAISMSIIARIITILSDIFFYFSSYIIPRYDVKETKDSKLPHK